MAMDMESLQRLTMNMKEILLQRLLNLLDEMSEILVRDETFDGNEHYLRESFTDRDNYYQYVHKEREFIYLLAQYNRNYVDYLSNVMWTGASMEASLRELYSLLLNK